MATKAVKERERQNIGISTLERYTGSEAADIQPFILLTNWDRYVDRFSRFCKARVFEGSVMQSCNWPESRISMINYGVGSPTAALIIELLSFIKPKAVLMLGMCGGLRKKQKIGDFFLPVAAIRGEGTSDHYMPSRVPSLSSFTIQRYVADILEDRDLAYHTGVIHSTNYRFWEFDEKFREDLITEKVQTIDMECATLFTAGYARMVPVGALMLISDKPLERGGIKTKESQKRVFETYESFHIECGINILRKMCGSPTCQIRSQW